MHASSTHLAGQGRLGFCRVGPRTVVETAVAHAPLKLLTPRNHGTAAWVVAANFGGGLVDGDHLKLSVHVGPGASGLLGTQASTKVYRSPRGTGQDLDVAIAEGGSLALIPDPIVCFEGSRYTQRQRLRLEENASLLFLDGLTSGRSARGERWDFARYSSRTLVERCGEPVVLDAVLLDPAHGSLEVRMGRFEAFVTLVALGSAFAPICKAALESSPTLERRGAVVRSVAPLGADGVVVRVAGITVEATTRAIRGYLTGLSDLLGDDPFARRW